jgi:CheY-like chemotaxis protein
VNVRRIMLVDDNRDDIFFHTRTIKKSHPEIEVVPMVDAVLAIDYLKLALRNERPPVDLILLDINMPGMSGWDFLDEYASLAGDAGVRRHVTMLTTSSRDEERARALAYPAILDFRTKPLTASMLEEILIQLAQNQ